VIIKSAKVFRGLGMAIGLLTVWRPAIAQDIPGLPFLQNFSVRDFKAYHQNWAAIQAPNGLMYFANNNGVLEFDGVNWRLTAIPNRSTVRSIDADSSGVVYVGAQGDFGLVRPDGRGGLQYRSLLDRVPDRYRHFADVWSVHVTRQGVYFRTKKYLFRWNAPSLTVIESATSFHRSYVIGGAILVSQEKVGITRVDGDSTKPWPGGAFFADRPIYAMVPFPQGGVLVGTQKDGFFLLRGGEATPFPTQADSYLRERQMYNGAVLADGTIAIATLYGGVVVLAEDGSIVSVVDRSTGLISDKVHGVWVDREYGLWLALDNGLARIEPVSPFSWYEESSGLVGNVQAVARHEGRLYAATSRGVYRLESVRSPSGTPLARFAPVGTISTQCWSLLERHGTLLCGTNDGVYAIRKGRVRHLGGTTSFHLYASTRDSLLVYAGLKDGVAVLRFRDGQWNLDDKLAGVTGEIRAVLEHGDDLWLGSKFQGAWRIRRSTAEASLYDTSRGVPAGWVRVFEVGGRPIFSSETGLYRYDSAVDRFLPDSVFGAQYTGRVGVSPLQEDSAGRVWINSGNEIVMAEPDAERTYTIREAPFQRIPDEMEINVIYPDGRWMWFGGTEGLIRFDFGRFRDPLTPLPTLLRRVTLMKTDSALNVSSTDEAELPHAYNALRFEFSLPSFDHVSRNQYRYWLEPFDADWSVWNEQTKKEYTNLPEGTYVFHVQGRTVYGRPAREATLAFAIRPPWYRAWYAVLMYTALSAGLLTIGIRARVRVLTARNRMLEEKVRERTKALEEAQVRLIHSEKMAAVGQMVAGLAHEINNPLTFVYANHEYIRERVQKLVQMLEAVDRSRDMLSDEVRARVDRIKHELEYEKLVPELDQALQSALYGGERIKNIVENLRHFADIEAGEMRETDLNRNLDIIVDLFMGRHGEIDFVRRYEPLPPVRCYVSELNQCVMNVLRNAVQAVEDARNRGTLPTYVSGRIDIETRTGGNGWVEIAIRDNGIGIPEEIRTKIFDPFFTTRKVGLGKGIGLTEAYAIVQKHHGLIDVQSQLHEGTEVTIRLPVQT
jgi:signal transduction histidine kinase